MCLSPHRTRLNLMCRRQPDAINKSVRSGGKEEGMISAILPVQTSARLASLDSRGNICRTVIREGNPFSDSLHPDHPSPVPSLRATAPRRPYGSRAQRGRGCSCPCLPRCLRRRYLRAEQKKASALTRTMFHLTPRNRVATMRRQKTRLPVGSLVFIIILR